MRAPGRMTHTWTFDLWLGVSMDPGAYRCLVCTHKSGRLRACEAVSSVAPVLHETYHCSFLLMLRLQISCQLLGHCACGCSYLQEPRASLGKAHGLFHRPRLSPPCPQPPRSASSWPALAAAARPPE